MRSILIIGLGRFGRHLSMRLSELGNELLVIDQDERCVNEIAPFVTAAQIGDCTDESVIKSLGASEFDLSFVCISNNLETSLIITMMLKEQGAKKVIAKVNQDIFIAFLIRIRQFPLAGILVICCVQNTKKLFFPAAPIAHFLKPCKIPGAIPLQ